MDKIIKKPKFKYHPRPYSSKVLLRFKKDDDIRLENPALMTKAEWSKKFNLHQLHNYWKQRTRLNFDLNEQRFSEDILPEEIRKNLYSRNRFLLQKNKFCPDNQKKLKKLFDASHGIGYEDYFESDNSKKYININYSEEIEGRPAWNKDAIFTEEERKKINQNLFRRSTKGTKDYWSSRQNGKKYYNPIQTFNNEMRLLKKIKDQSEVEKDLVTKKIYEDKKEIIKTKETLDCLVLKEMQKIYSEKMKKKKTVGIVKEKIRKRNISDEELAKKFGEVNDWLSATNFTNKKDFLKPLVSQNMRIKKEEEKMNDLEEQKRQKEQEPKKLKGKLLSISPQSTQLNTASNSKDSSFEPKENNFLKAYMKVSTDVVRNEKEKEKVYKEKYDVNYYHNGAYVRIFTNFLAHI